MLIRKNQKGRFVKYFIGSFALLIVLTIVALFLANAFITTPANYGELPDFSMENIPHFNLSIEETNLQKIKNKRAEALLYGILISNDSDKVKANLEFDELEAEAKIRLKGDWTDHLSGRKWSFRIQVKKPYAWNRMVDFSVMSPKTREFLSEWVFHQLLDKEGVLSTRYDFMFLTLNGESRGLYAYEEHFAKQLPEYHHRREGPILKLVEDGLWNVRMMETKENVNLDKTNNFFNSAAIAPFKKGSTMRKDNLRKQYLIAQNLLYQLRYGLAPASDLVEVEKAAKFLALTDLTRTYHGLIWHNLRFYYNPVLSKLEPIGFDGDTGADFDHYLETPLLIQHSQGHRIVHYLLKDPAIRKLYKQYLAQYSSEEYLDAFFKEIEEEMNYREELLQREFLGYEFDRDGWNENAEVIRVTLEAL